MPKETTGPKSGSSMLRIATGTPGRRVRLHHEVGAVGVADRARVERRPRRRASRSASSMLRHTWARSGRSRRCSAVALSTTSQPSRSPAARASSSVATGTGVPQVDAVGREQLGDLVAVEVARRRGARSSSLVDQPLGARRRSTSAGSGVGPSGVRSHTAYSTTRASARTAASTAGYDGTEPRPAVEPATSGTRSSSGTPSAPRKVETSGLSDCSPTAASTLATSSPETLSGGM